MLALLILALALAMDAFAVSLIRGSADGRSLGEAGKLGFTFGLAQGLMPLVGWGLGEAFADMFRFVDHWIAFTLLVILGGRMLFEGLRGSEKPEATNGHGPLLGLLVAAFATSIDAAAAGVTLPLLGVAIPLACLAIGITTGILCTAGYLIGARTSRQAGRWAEMFGGIVLIGLGAKILVEHLGG